MYPLDREKYLRAEFSLTLALAEEGGLSSSILEGVILYWREECFLIFPYFEYCLSLHVLLYIVLDEEIADIHAVPHSESLPRLRGESALFPANLSLLP